MSRGSVNDALGVLRGLQIFAEAVLREQRSTVSHLWTNSSVRELIKQNIDETANSLRAAGKEPTEELKKLQYYMQETSERGYVVAKGIQKLAATKISEDLAIITQTLSGISSSVTQTGRMNNGRGERRRNSVGRGGSSDNYSIRTNTDDVDAANLDISSITLRELEEILSKRSKNRNVSLRTPLTKSKQVPEQGANIIPPPKIISSPNNDPIIKTPPPTSPPSIPPPESKSNARIVSTNATLTSTKIIPGTLDSDTHYVSNVLKFVAGATTTADDFSSKLPHGASNPINLPELSKIAKQRRVPSSRLGRMASFGSLFAGLGFGTINELTKGALGLGGATNMRDALLSPANAERIVDTLCKVRGAALKIGQILSIQDSNVVSPQLAKAFERVRQAADYMPDWQVSRVMSTELGENWREHFTKFDEKPFAAASIGQVHRATLKNGMEVAIKIQYPGVAQSIESDIDNLVGMLKVWDVFPQGFFIDNVVRVAKRELRWEVDYQREAEYTEKFKEMISPYPEYYVPHIIKDLSTQSLLTTELVPGVPLDKCFDLSYEHRKHIAEVVMKLCLRELFEIQCMQTDPNWSNFLYDETTKRLMLIDFGSTRFYDREFIKNYRHIIMCAAENNPQGVLDMSRQMGFLTGYETKQMENAHVDAVMILGEVFRFDGDFDFGRQNTTERVAQLVPTMVAHRLCPPPEEIYSIHRKLSGIFLLCSRLNVRMNCRPFYQDIVLDKFK